MSELRVDPAELAALGQQLLALADRAAQLHEKAQSIVHTAGPCWGDDEPGRQFADTYLPDAGAISGKASQFVQALRVYGNNVTATARNLSDQDRIGGAAVNPQTPKQVSVALPAGSTPSASARYPGNGADSASPGTVSAPGSNAPAAPASATSVAQPNRAGAPNQATAPNRTASPEQAGDSDPAPRQSASAPRSPDETMPGSSSAKDPAATRPQSTSSPRTSAEPSRTSPSLTAESARPADAGAPTGPDGAQRTGQLAKASGSQPDSDSDHANPRPAPPRQRKQDEAKQQPKAPGKASQEQAERPKSRAAEELAKHYGVRLAGLDLPGADESALAELDAALESFLRRYPFAAPRTVAIRALPEGEWSQVSWIRDQAGAPVTDEVAVTTAIVLDPAGFTEQVADAVGQGFVTTGSGQRPAFSTMIRALGGGVDVAGGFVARQGAQRALISAYLGPARSDSMRAVSAAPVVGGFREWRGQLSGRSFRHGMFDPGPALAEAFTEVELLGADAGPPARVLHEVLVAAARESERPRGPR